MLVARQSASMALLVTNTQNDSMQYRHSTGTILLMRLQKLQDAVLLPDLSRKRESHIRTALPISPMLRQLAKEEGRPLLRTALPGSPMLRQLAWEPPPFFHPSFYCAVRTKQLY